MSFLPLTREVEGLRSALTKVSVLVPSYRRPESLTTCLDALEEQTEEASEVLVITHGEDRQTRDLVASRQRSRAMNIRPQLVWVPGQVAALSAGVAAATGDIVAITDDDAAPRRDWIAGLKRCFELPGVVGAGGRDLISGQQPDRLEICVGKVRWSGKVVGNHHLGTGAARDVDLLKGANMAFRRDALAMHGFDHRLRGRGAQVHNDLKLCLDLKRAGGRLVYDPAVLVDHRPAPRPDGELRPNLPREQQIDAVHNETLALLEFLPAQRQLAFVARSVLVGRRSAPGIAHAVLGILRYRDATSIRGLGATIRGRWLGWRTYRNIN